ncbi:transcriptional regulator [Sorangium cellulosum]|uniref:Transcriptional regulator n=1 Tax=Sorangium cellulosum TaxID=56 RepID=A0A4P2Q779_SORCE|nr:response regulator [Sorangium cellulosum]AUX25367.1 transcriptional regulator [Sorangium cellulosum]
MSQARPHVLVVDAEQRIRDRLADELREGGFDVTCADTGLAAIELVKARRFDLAVADIRAPGMGGPETVAALKALSPDLEILVGATRSSAQAAVECMKSGAYDILEKPYDIEDMKRRLGAAMLRTHLDAIAAVHQASTALVASLARDDFPERAVDLAAKVVYTSAAALSLALDQGAALFQAASGVEVSPALVARLAAQAEGAPAPVRLSADEAPELLCTAEGDRFGAAIAAPLRLGERAFGGLVVLRDERLPAFTSQEEQAIGIFAIELALALHGHAAPRMRGPRAA